MVKTTVFPNPFRPGAGHPPPYLAGRVEERAEFARLLDQTTVLKNPILTGLRGVGKTVLLESFKPLARDKGWLWAGSDLSEAVSVGEERLAIRLCTDLGLITSDIVVPTGQRLTIGFGSTAEVVGKRLTVDQLTGIYSETPGLPIDKIKTVLQFAWSSISSTRPGVRGVIFAYDEAQTLGNRPNREQYPLSLLLDVFQSLQRQGMPLMLALTGLPTLFPALVQARTSSERMFRVLSLRRLNAQESADAIRIPLETVDSPWRLTDDSVTSIVEMSGGYPYFLQFICKEGYDAFRQRHLAGEEPLVPLSEIERKLDDDFFSGRWARTTDRQRQLLWIIAHLDSADDEFTVQQVVEKARSILERPFSPSHTNQMLASLASQGLVFKNRHGRYSFAVPLLDRFIRRQPSPTDLA